jgi:hypothetical protein
MSTPYTPATIAGRPAEGLGSERGSDREVAELNYECSPDAELAQRDLLGSSGLESAPD